PGEHVDRTGKRRRDRGNEHRVTAICKLLDDEAGHQSILDFDQRRLPLSLITLPRQSLRQTSDDRVAGYALEERTLQLLHDRPASPRAGGGTDEKTDKQDQQE